MVPILVRPGHSLLRLPLVTRIIMPLTAFVFRIRSRPVILLVAGLIMLGLAVAVTTGLLAKHLRNSALMEADHEQRGVSLILANQAERAFEGVELLQAALLERWQNDGIVIPDQFRQLMVGADVHNELAKRALQLPQLDAIEVIDVDGNLVNSSKTSPLPLDNAVGRDFYEALKGHPEQTTFISAPTKVGGIDRWTIYVARKVVNPDGEFLGIVLGAMNLTYFEQLYQVVANRDGSAISLRRQDGTILVRYPHGDLRRRQELLKSGTFRVAEADGIVMRRLSPIDGVERLIAARSLVHYPVVVTVSNTISSILAEWRGQVVYMAGTAIALELILAAVGLLMVRHLRGQEMLNKARAAKAEAEAELMVANERELAALDKEIQMVRFGAALSNMSQALCMFDAAGLLVVSNNRLAEMFGVDAGSIHSGMTIENLLGRSGVPSNLAQTDRDSMRQSIEQLMKANKPALRVRELADGRSLALSFVTVKTGGWLITYEDITERRLAEAKISHMAHHDALTGLPNRVLFHERLTEAVARSKRGESCAVLCLDLDNFKAVNDTLGHPTGDALLREVTRRMRAQIRETDTLARLGGDEFAIVQSSVDQPQNATALAARLVELLAVPYEFDGQQIVIGASIGIAIVPDDGDDPDRILKNADLALYGAKADGRGLYRFFEPEMDAIMQARRSLEMDLRKALVAGEFELFYQPLMNIKTGSITGFEALMRWFHPTRGMVSPLDFIPVAEEIGLIVPLGKWALRRACLDAATWPGDRKVAVNVSSIQFGSHTLVEDVVAALEESRLDPSRLELEITETVMLDDTDAILVILHQLRDLGVGIAMDDFGTGYSSLSYLRRFPFSKVKIDRSFIEDLGTGGDSDAIVTAVTDLCATLGMITLAEGVETAEQLQQLRAGNCGEAQGYFFSRPRPASEVASMCQHLTMGALEAVPG